MLVTHFRGYTLLHKQNVPVRPPVEEPPLDDLCPLHDLYESSFDPRVLFENLSRTSVSHPHFSLLYRETLFNPTLQLRVIRDIPDLYHPILWLAGLMDDLGDDGTLLDGCQISSSEWEILSDLNMIVAEFEHEDSRLIHRIREIKTEPLMLFKMARALYVTRSLLRGVDLTHLVDRMLPRIDLIELYLENGTLPTPLSNGGKTLLLLDHNNIFRLLERSPFASCLEYSEEAYLKITGLSKRQLRRSIIWNLWTHFELSIIDPTQFRPIDEELILWYNRTEINKLSRGNLESLCQLLQRYPREGWTKERIQMRFRMVVSPDWSLTQFCQEYDQSLYDLRDAQMERIGSNMIGLLESLGPTYKIQSSLDWIEFLERLEGDQSFRIPLLSPRGLLMIYDMTPIQVTPFMTKLLGKTLEQNSDWARDHQIQGLYNQRDDYS